MAPLLAAAVLMLGAGFTQARSGPELCSSIAGDRERLACFDGFFGTPDKALASQVQAEPAIDTGLLGPASPESALVDRRDEELDLSTKWFSITPHKPNYLLPATYNVSSDYDTYGPFSEEFNDWEIKLQLSLKTLLARNLWRDSSIWVGYTQQSYWQLYADEEASAPFRETNHQPEIFWDVPIGFNVMGWNARLATLALNHQSNGRAEPLSRSWNRVTGELVFDRGPFVASVKSWHRIDENAEDDNNPDIEDYMGRIQLGLAYKRGNQVFSLGIKNNLSGDNRSGVEINWTFPLLERLKGFIQVYSGYGENLIDAENYNNRIGVGVALTDWL